MYEHALAERLGMTVSEMEARMSIEEFDRWMAFDRLTAERMERDRKATQRPE